MSTQSRTRAAGRARLAELRLAPRGLDIAEAAAYVGVGVGTFQAMVDDGRMPRARALESRLVWDRAEIDEHFSRLPYSGGSSADEGATVDERWQARA